MIFIFCENSYANDLEIGKQFKTIKTIYIEGVYKDTANKNLNKETASAFLSEVKHYKKSYMAFQNEVPIGTIITILGPATKPWYLYFNSDRYFVKIDPDLSQGLDVMLSVDSLLEKGLGSSTNLNSEIFTPVP